MQKGKNEHFCSWHITIFFLFSFLLWIIRVAGIAHAIIDIVRLLLLLLLLCAMSGRISILIRFFFLKSTLLTHNIVLMNMPRHTDWQDRVTMVSEAVKETGKCDDETTCLLLCCYSW